MFWLVAQRMDLFQDGAKVMHIAPERWLVKKTDVRQKCDYRAFDIDPDKIRREVGPLQRPAKFPV